MTAWLRLHAGALAQAAHRIFSRPLDSGVTLSVLAMAIALPVIASIGLRSVGAATSRLDTEPHVNVFLAMDAREDEARAVEQALRARPEVAAVRFIPRAEALAELKSTTHLAEILEALERNPLPDAFTVRLRADAADPDALRAQIAALPKVDQVAADFEWSRKLAGWVRFGSRVLVVLSALLAVAIALIVGHLVRLQVLTHRQEIEVSQLVGATAADVRRPFLYHGALQGILSGALAVLVASAVAAWTGHQLSALTDGYANELKVLLLALPEAAGVVGIAAALGVLGAWVAVNRELRRFSSP
jgi:cell division transport system permease protein